MMTEIIRGAHPPTKVDIVFCPPPQILRNFQKFLSGSKIIKLLRHVPRGRGVQGPSSGKIWLNWVLKYVLRQFVGILNISRYGTENVNNNLYW